VQRNSQNQAAKAHIADTEMTAIKPSHRVLYWTICFSQKWISSSQSAETGINMERHELTELHYITPIANIQSIFMLGLLSYSRTNHSVYA